MALTLPPAKTKGSQCLMSKALAALDAKERKQVEAWIADSSIEGSRIDQALGLGTGQTQRHRRGHCSHCAH